MIDIEFRYFNLSQGGMVEMRHSGNNSGGHHRQPVNPISLGGFPLKLSKSRPFAGGTGSGINSSGVNIVRHARLQKHSRGAGGFGTSKNSYSRTDKNIFSIKAAKYFFFKLTEEYV
uniref:Uncharacterized protein n=1 Tax=Romanomermis culicivorax TaxID=13658 RepID=A0A915HX75_ROMCU